ncbi:alanyl-tRNA synthetase [Crocinitomix algicola]|uniref:alanyl-tRNA synthetase n=1 Tax=Crocinitomix algicola TaxID=1740263 RepID=UPI000BBA1576|nr:alanyl-tRNA synthetase [Crocinitomix algicola]
MTEIENNKNKTPKKKWYHNAWLQRIGLAGFLFFLFKGLAWLALWFGLFKWFGAE